MKVKVKAKLKNLRISPRKVRISADMVRGCGIRDAIFRLDNTIKKANEPIKNLIKSAAANARNDFDLDMDNLKVSDIQVGEGMTMKRWTPRAYGRATQILKRSSHVYLTLEAEEGSKKSVSDKKDKKEEVKDLETVNTEGSKKTVDKVEDEKKNISKGAKKGHFEPEGKRKESREKGWNKKIFKRKSM